MNTIPQLISYTKASRQMLLDLLENYSLEQLNFIPEGYSNNLLWNQAHLVATFDLLVYGLSGLELSMDKELYSQFKKGTRPIRFYSEDLRNKISEDSLLQLDIFLENYKKGIFTEFNKYTTSLGVELNSLEEALKFLLIHEGLHLGYCISMRKLV